MSANLVTINDSTIRALMQDPQVLEALPCLKNPKKQLESVQTGGTNCARCQREKKRIAASAFNTAKECIKSARGARLDKIKKVLGTKQVRVIAKNAQGKKVQYTLK